MRSLPPRHIEIALFVVFYGIGWLVGTLRRRRNAATSAHSGSQFQDGED